MKNEELVKEQLLPSNNFLKIVIESIRKNYKVQFVVEEAKTEGGSVFYLKQRKTIKLPFNKVKHIDQYEINGLGFRIVFRSPSLIVDYLKLMYSEREGFVLETEELE